MEWFQLYVNDLSNRLLSAASSSAFGAWVRMLANCYRLENGGCYEHCSGHSSRQWMSIAQVDRVEVDEVVKAGLAAWEDGGLRVHGYDIEQQQKATERKEKGRLAASARWGHAPSIAPGNAEERKGEEKKGEEKIDNTCPAAEPAGLGGVGGDVPVLQLVSTEAEPAATKARKPTKLDPASNVLAVFNHYHHKHHHPMRLQPDPKSKAGQAIAARLREGWSVAELCKAIDGFHLSPFHQGQNDKGTPYLGLKTLMRDREQVEKGIEMAENPPKPGSGAKTVRDVRVGGTHAEDYRHPDKPGPIDMDAVLRGQP